MRISKSCDTLAIRPFFKIFETDDMRFLIKGYDSENDNIKLTKKQYKEFNEIFRNIFYEYSEITQNHKLRSNYKKQILIEQWTYIYTIITNCINIYQEFKQPEVLLLINKLNETAYQFDIKRDIPGQIRGLIHRMKGLKNKIKIFKIKMSKSYESDKKEVKLDLDRDALYLERNLELKREVDPDTTSVSKWVGMIQMSKQKAKDYASSKNNK